MALTERQRKFVHAYATNGQNGTQAAREAGYKGTDNALAVVASRTLRLSNVVTALAELTGKAIAKAEKGAIASLEECLTFQTTVLRSRLADYLGDDGEASITKLKAAPAGLIRKIKIRSTTDAEGQVFAEHEIAAESALAASQSLIKHHTGEKDPGDGNRTEIRAVIFNLIAGRESRADLEQLARRAAVDIAPIR